MPTYGNMYAVYWHLFTSSGTTQVFHELDREPAL